MSVIKIDASLALKDIRNGMSRSELMKKYKLSPKGLDSLFRKLEEALSQMNGHKRPQKEIKAVDILNDLNSGLNEVELMEKYKISALALNGLLRELVQNGVFDSPRSIPMNKRDLIWDIKRKIPIHVMMERHRIQFGELLGRIDEYTAAGLLGVEELNRYDAFLDASADLYAIRPLWAKKYRPKMLMDTMDVVDPSNCGQVLDLYPCGFSSEGLAVDSGETKTLYICAEQFLRNKPLVFDCRCTNVVTDKSGADHSYFKFENIAPVVYREYETLVKTFCSDSPFDELELRRPTTHYVEHYCA